MSDKTDKPGDWRKDESSVMRAYGELKETVPPAHLDERILAEARRVAAKEDDTVVRVHRWRRWTMPAALAATVIFAVPLVVRVFETTAPPPERAPAMVETDAVPAELADRLPTDRARRELAGQSAQPAAAPAPANAFDQPLAVSATAADDGPGKRPDSAQQQAVVPDAAITPAESEPQRQAAAEESRDSGSEYPREDAQAQLPQRAETDAYAGSEPAGLRPHARMSGAQVAPMAADTAMANNSRQSKSLGRSGGLMPVDWLDEIASLHESGRELTARRELGLFLAEYPEYQLPQGYPLRAEEAIRPAVIPDAREWLRDIAQLVDRGDNDRARMQLAEFLDYYPDYALPPDFPLRREDAVIER
ncbi:MAG: hypothetical protein HKO55_10710 [Gammaproteobacteria bacterium]|nr:hypothetical protein [Gammaproteobacteria bacterium]NNM21733.1 hypothetical protein [Gammaproteobacteria bacterium]